MNVLMIGSGYNGCNYVRIHLPAYHNGYRLDRPTLKSDRISMDDMFQEMKQADVVVFHRPESEDYSKIIDVLKADGKKVVVDNDDTFMIDDDHPLATFTPDAKEIILDVRENAFKSMAAKADIVTASTEFLANEYKDVNDNVIVLPNCIDPMDWDEPIRNCGDKVRIGIVGSAAFIYDSEHLRKIIKDLDERDDVQIVMFGLGDIKHRKENELVTKAFKPEYDFWDSMTNLEHAPWVPIHLYQDTLNNLALDIMIIPRRDNYFNRCKSNVKFLEASMLEIPVIAQSFKDGPYEEITHNKNGILIKNNKDWDRHINRLIDEPELRIRIGKEAKKYTLDNYNIENNYKLWEEAYQKLCDTK